MSIEVWIDATHVGSVERETRPGFHAESLTFAYLDSWLSDDRSFAISPDLPLQRGPQTPATHRTTFQAFDDAAPDRWGRELVELGNRMKSKSAGERYKPLGEIDLLLAVSDTTRQGALRFGQDGSFLSPNTGSADLQDVKKLAATARHFVDSGMIDEDMQALIGAGSSPGGAQPKAWVRDTDGGLLLAKFPKTSDLSDVSAWELAMIKLQRRAGIGVQPARTISLREGESIFLTSRFDREAEKRIPYMSFKNAFGIADHSHPDYATLARRVAGISSSPDADAAQLFSRAAFTVLVNNIDDHMRNHGLLRDGAGWRLSPSFDVNPYRGGHSDTPLTEEDDPRDRDVRLLLEAADSFRLTRDDAVDRLKVVEQAVSHWREDAVSAGVDPEALDWLATSFESENSDRIRSLSAPDSTHASPSAASQASGDVWVRPHIRRGVKIEGHFRHQPE